MMTNADRPEPSASVRAYFTAEDRPRRSYFAMSLPDLRTRYLEEFEWGGGELSPMAEIDDVIANGVPARLYRPHGGENSVLVWLHGGGWNLGSVACHEWISRALASQAGCAVLSADYRLAPEHRYPAAVEDAWAATVWAASHFDHVAVGGDSAGGTLAATVARCARDAQIPVVLQVLVYPVVDYRVDHPTYRDFSQRYVGFGLDPSFGEDFQRTIADIWEQYIPDPARRVEPDASPLRVDSLSGVAPAVLITAEHDILRPENEEFAHRLKKEGVSVEVVEYAGQIHGFFPLVGVMPEAQDAVRHCAQALGRAFATAGQSQS